MEKRREFIKKLLPLSALPFIPASLSAKDKNEKSSKKETVKRPKVIFFDVNETLLDLEPLKKSIIKILNNKQELGTLWFTTMLQYSLVATASKKYFDFGLIGAATLRMVAKNNGIEVNEEQAMLAVKPILSLKSHAEVRESLELLKKNNFKLVSFTNSSNFAVDRQLIFAKIDTYFDEKISVEDYGKFKPDTEVYHWAARKLNVSNDECLLVAAHGWDIAGAAWAGWKTAFIARPGQQLFPLAPTPEFSKTNLLEIVNELIVLSN